MNKRHIFFILLSVTAVMYGCSAKKAVTGTPVTALPETYTGNRDSIDASMVTNAYFFKDDSLRSLITAAITENLDLQNAYQNIQIARASLRNARGLMLPTANGLFAPNIRKFGFYTMDGAGNATTEIQPGKLIPVHLPDYFAGFQSSWEPDIYGKLKNQKQAALARYLSTIEGKNWLQTNIINTLVLTYYEILALDEQLQIIQQNIQLQQEMLEMIETQKEAARTTALAIDQFKAQILNARTLAKELEQAILENEKMMNLLLSRYPKPVQRNRNWLLEQPAVVSTGIPSQLLQNRTDIRMAQYELEASRFDVEVARKSFYPTLTINATVGLQAFSPATFFNAQSVAYGLFGGLLAPVFNRSALKAQFNTQTALQLQALNNYQQTMLTAFGEVYTGMRKIDNISQAIQLKTEEVKVLENAIENARLLFQSNRADYLEVLTAQQNLLEAKLSLVQLKKNQYQETANLFKAIGGGWK
ncbi:NodT family efflux transporter outer membrane factor (OMF) lipoprotein [Lacibacter cauensis]|uniref:NodT family efflux transporter outer membrane factor (OMF) lipoprotein n=1 Tax=Lacibacter cauensis TaxID=510947 RepID=A0A562SDZ8_9BACT|nr:efflux transporter outer membrane subunit [Lacibacter cauensis]TWI79000.1 NodT family efflux transporter outer membrane factor (OMF) lipoprotein [Lacibacter cauensis]